MSIRFACPSCGSILNIASRKAGAEVGCPRCRQRIIVPTPVPPSPPRPGILVEPDPPTDSMPPEESERDNDRDDYREEYQDYDEEWEDDDRPRQERQSARRFRNRIRSPFVTGLAIGHLLLSICCLTICALIGIFGSVILMSGRGGDPKEIAQHGLILVLICSVVALMSIPDMLTAYGLYHRRPWGRSLGLVMAGLNMIWAMLSVCWGDICSIFLCGMMGIFAFAVLLTPSLAAEFRPRRWRR